MYQTRPLRAGASRRLRALAQVTGATIRKSPEMRCLVGSGGEGGQALQWRAIEVDVIAAQSIAVRQSQIHAVDLDLGITTDEPKAGPPEHRGAVLVAQGIGLSQGPVHPPAVEKLRQVVAQGLSPLHEAAGVRVAIANVGGVAADDAVHFLGVPGLQEPLGQLDGLFSVHGQS
ncbi:conserved hypothetical protein [Mycobacterium ulcerans subsp. shinshuense]|uniref:Uncharacterized protein n=1 Tax=Mycobacterium ulcerans subsp. shinshuense TaxID=1124626 RepID=A0A1B4Y756_MYCUL|nr:conserved hypothetical protein [Mycobacterium ulcerans subsp. shinshuense]